MADKLGALHAQGPLALALIGGGALLMWAVLAGATFPWEAKTTATDKEKDQGQNQGNQTTMNSPMGPLQSLALFGTASDLADLAGIVA